MKTESADKWFRTLFLLNAVLLMSASLAIFLPDNMMAIAHKRLGLGDFPSMPIVEYLARSCSLLYAVHGIVLFAIARNLSKYRDLVPLMIGLHFGLGCFMLGIDIKAAMPNYWTYLEGPGIIGFSVLLFVLWRNSGLRLGDASD